MKEENLQLQFREEVLSERRLLDCAGMTGGNSTAVFRTGRISMSTGRRPAGDQLRHGGGAVR